MELSSITPLQNEFYELTDTRLKFIVLPIHSPINVDKFKVFVEAFTGADFSDEESLYICVFRCRCELQSITLDNYGKNYHYLINVTNMILYYKEHLYVLETPISHSVILGPQAALYIYVHVTSIGAFELLFESEYVEPTKTKRLLYYYNKSVKVAHKNIISINIDGDTNDFMIPMSSYISSTDSIIRVYKDGILLIPHIDYTIDSELNNDMIRIICTT